MATFKAIFKKTLFQRKLSEVLLGRSGALPRGRGWGHPALAEGTPSQSWRMLAESSQVVSPDLGPVRSPAREGTAGMIWREPGQPLPLEISCHFPDIQTCLFCARSVCRAGVGFPEPYARGLPKAPAPHALGTPVQAPPRA